MTTATRLTLDEVVALVQKRVYTKEGKDIIMANKYELLSATHNPEKYYTQYLNDHDMSGYHGLSVWRKEGRRYVECFRITYAEYCANPGYMFNRANTHLPDEAYTDKTNPFYNCVYRTKKSAEGYGCSLEPLIAN